MAKPREVLAAIYLVIGVLFFSHFINAEETGSRKQPQIVTSSIEDLEQRAKQGDAAAQSALAVHYFSGKGVTKNYKEAAKLFHEAAKNGDQFSMYALGDMYAHGWGFKADPIKSQEWLKKAILTGGPVTAEAQALLQKVTQLYQQALAMAQQQKMINEQQALLEQQQSMIQQQRETQHNEALMRFGATMLASGDNFFGALGQATQAYSNPNYTPPPPSPPMQVIQPIPTPRMTTTNCHASASGGSGPYGVSISPTLNMNCTTQ